MRMSCVILLVMALAGSALAQPFTDSRSVPVKPVPPTAVTVLGEDDPGQGDTMDDPFEIDGLPFHDTGCTIGFVDDYDAACPYVGSEAPDVVYAYKPSSDIMISVDLCGSGYDTKVFILQGSRCVVACNDDYHLAEPCGETISKIERADLEGGEIYYIVVDGFASDRGDYEITVTEFKPCTLECDVDAMIEGEPELYDGYVDDYNNGCNGYTFNLMDIDWVNIHDGEDPEHAFAELCGRSGWYYGSNGYQYRDTDWYRVIARETGTMEFIVEAEYSCTMMKLMAPDCSAPVIEFETMADCGSRAMLNFPVTEGEEIWLVVAPMTFTGPVREFTYTMKVNNNVFEDVAAETMSMSQVKAMYR